jgi:hypothetical protein
MEHAVLYPHRSRNTRFAIMQLCGGTNPLRPRMHPALPRFRGELISASPRFTRPPFRHDVRGEIVAFHRLVTAVGGLPSSASELPLFQPKQARVMHASHPVELRAPGSPRPTNPQAPSYQTNMLVNGGRARKQDHHVGIINRYCSSCDQVAQMGILSWCNLRDLRRVKWHCDSSYPRASAGKHCHDAPRPASMLVWVSLPHPVSCCCRDGGVGDGGT